MKYFFWTSYSHVNETFSGFGNCFTVSNELPDNPDSLRRHRESLERDVSKQFPGANVVILFWREVPPFDVPDEEKEPDGPAN